MIAPPRPCDAALARDRRGRYGAPLSGLGRIGLLLVGLNAPCAVVAAHSGHWGSVAGFVTGLVLAAVGYWIERRRGQCLAFDADWLSDHAAGHQAAMLKDLRDERGEVARWLVQAPVSVRVLLAIRPEDLR